MSVMSDVERYESKNDESSFWVVVTLRRAEGWCLEMEVKAWTEIMNDVGVWLGHELVASSAAVESSTTNTNQIY